MASAVTHLDSGRFPIAAYLWEQVKLFFMDICQAELFLPLGKGRVGAFLVSFIIINMSWMTKCSFQVL